MDEVAKKLVGPEGAGVDKVLELLLHLLLSQPPPVVHQAIRLGQEVRLVEGAELIHEALVELRVLQRPAISADAQAQPGRIVQMWFRES